MRDAECYFRIPSGGSTETICRLGGDTFRSRQEQEIVIESPVII